MKKKKVNAIIQILILWLCIFTFFPKKNPEVQSLIPREGDVFHHLLVSPINFDIPKSPEKLVIEKKRARDRVLPVFEYDEKGSEESKEQIEKFKSNLLKYRYYNSRLADSIGADTLAIYKERASYYFSTINKKLSGSALETFIAKPQLLKTASRILEEILNKGISNYLVANNLDEVEEMRLAYQLQGIPVLKTTHSEVSLIKGDDEIRIKKQLLKPLEARLEIEFEEFKKEDSFDIRDFSALYEFSTAYSKANLFYLEKETERRRDEEESLVLPSKGKVFKGMQIIGAGEIVTKESIEKIRALYSELKKDKSRLAQSLPIIGIMIYCLLLALVLYFFLKYLKNISPHNRHNLIPIFILPILQVILFYSNDYIISLAQELIPQSSFNNADLILGHPFMVGAILGVVLFSFEIGLLIGLFSAIYYGSFNGFDLYYTYMALFTSLVGVHYLKDIRYRSDLLKGWTMSFITMVVMILIGNLFQPNFDAKQVLTESIIGLLNITVSFSVCALLLIPIFEKSFNITTNLRLIELSDFNHPALKRISLLTPGTFNHSLMVGNLSEKAAEEINANPLLVRVMALYHDIGKSLHPEFFTENQKSGDSPHKKMSPEKSAEIIISHVEGAYALAKEYKIPPTIIAGIPEHHGTGTIHYFYHKAKELSGEDIPESLFQYKGPKPQSKETAILMLADAIEATTRSLKDPSPENLRSTVNQVINSRLFEGELNESGLNLTDLKKIEIGFLKALEGMYHTRIKYPKGAFLTSPQLQKE